MGVAALVLGIIGVLFSINPWLFWIGVPMSIIALILGVLGRKSAMADNRPAGAAVAGMVLGIIGTSVGLLIFAMCAACAKKMNDLGKEIEKETKKGTSSRLAAPTGPTAKLGEQVTFDGDSTWVVTSARDRGKQLERKYGEPATTEGRFVEVTFRITNLGQKEDSLFDLPPVADGKGREYKPYADGASFLAPGKKGLMMAPLPPAIAKEYTEIYEVPADAKELTVRVRALAPFGATRAVALGLGDDEAAASPAPALEGAALDKKFAEAQDAYVHGQYAEAVKLASALPPTFTKRERLIGASSCFLKDRARALEAFGKLDPQGQQFLKYVCSRSGVPLQ